MRMGKWEVLDSHPATCRSKKKKSTLDVGSYVEIYCKTLKGNHCVQSMELYTETVIVPKISLFLINLGSLLYVTGVI